MDQKSLQSLPRGWVITTLDEVALWGSGGTPSRKNPEFYTGLIPWVKTGELGPKYIQSAEEHITQEAIQTSSAKVFPLGSVGIAMYGATIGKLSIWAADLSVNQACAVAQPHQELFSSEFLYYFLLSQKHALMERGKGGAQPNISQSILRAWPVCLPPINEQHRIVERIEELFSELDRGIESLKTARAQLKVYRQAVLKHAFEGKLTAQWREENKDKLETPEQLLARIKQERTGRYEQQFQEWRVAVREWESGAKRGRKPNKPRDPNPLGKLDESVPPNLPQLPESWAWEKLGWMTCGVEYGTAARSMKSGTVPVLRMGNIQNAKFDWTDLAYTSDDDEIAEYLLHDGDVLFNRTNSPELVGKTAIYRGECPAIFAGYLIRVNQICTIVESQYVNLFLNSDVARQHGNSVKTDGVNQSNINGAKLSNYPFPYCSIEEQREIARILEKTLSLLDDTEADISQELQKADALRQSILKTAFAGQLVAQDPNDEPASVLLDRIKAEKEQTSKSCETTKRTRKKRTVA